MGEGCPSRGAPLRLPPLAVLLSMGLQGVLGGKWAYPCLGGIEMWVHPRMRFLLCCRFPMGAAGITRPALAQVAGSASPAAWRSWSWSWSWSQGGGQRNSAALQVLRLLAKLRSTAGQYLHLGSFRGSTLMLGKKESATVCYE